MSAHRALFLVLGVVALSVFLLRPLCTAAHPQMHATEPASCCQAVGDAGAAKPLDLLADTSARPLVAPPSFAYLMGTVLFLAFATRFAAVPPPPRSYYARSSRILR